MIRYWLDENPKATYSKFLGILSEDEEHRSTVDKQYTPEELIGTLVPSSKGKDKTLKKLFDRNQLSTLESVPRHERTWNKFIDQLGNEYSIKLKEFLFDIEG